MFTVSGGGGGLSVHCQGAEGWGGGLSVHCQWGRGAECSLSMGEGG